MSVFKHLSPAPVIKHIWFGAPCCVQLSVSIRVSNTFCDSWFVHIICLQPFVSNNTSKVAWMPMPLPGVRRVVQQAVFLSVLHHVDALSRNSSMPTFQTPGFMCRSVTRSDQVRFTVTQRTLLVGQKEVFNERCTLVSQTTIFDPEC